MTYIVRELWKSHIKKDVNSGNRRKLLIVSSISIADKVIENVEKNNYSRYDIVGVALLDKDLIGNQINNVSVVANNETVGMYACKEWVDEVLIGLLNTSTGLKTFLHLHFLETPLVVFILNQQR